ncbi:MAG: hypothetical protein AAGA69_09350, partial [Pseudomonadota bacterium]
DILRRKDGDVFSEVDALLTPHRGNITKEYLMFGAFSHGAQRVYAGQFRVRAAVDGDAAPVETKHLLTMAPGIFEKLYAKGEWHTEPVTLDGYTDEQDGYVVFGDVPVTQFSGGDLMLDPGTPDWVRNGLLDIIPTAADYFAERLGPSTGPEVLTLITFAPVPDAERSSIEGGVLADQVHFHLTGGGWDQENDGLAMQLGWIAAHETAHVWNAFGIHRPAYFNRGPNGEGADIPNAQWMHEGGAEMLTFKALSDTGALPEEGLNRIIGEHYITCIAALERGVLNDAGDRGQFRDYYSCGLVIGLLTEAACRPHGRDYVDVWDTMTTTTSERPYGQSDYLDAHHICPGGEQAVTAIRRLAEEQIDAPADFLTEAFAHYGVEVDASGTAATFTPAFTASAAPR